MPFYAAQAVSGNARRCLRRTEWLGWGLPWSIAFGASGLVRGPLMCGVCLFLALPFGKPPSAVTPPLDSAFQAGAIRWRPYYLVGKFK